MTQFNMIDSASRPQQVAIHWEMRTPRDMSAGAPDSMADKWHYVGVQAVVTVFIPTGGKSFRVMTLESAGLWGIESNAGRYLREVYKEEQAGLMAELRTFAAAIASGNFMEEEAE